MEEDLELSEPLEEGDGLPSHDAGSGHLMNVLAHDDCVEEVGEGKEEELVDYGSFPECEAPKGGFVRPQLQAEVDVVEEEGTSSNEV